jgi:hypothetical protein
MLKTLSTKGNRVSPLIWINTILCTVNMVVIAFNLYWLMHQ